MEVVDLAVVVVNRSYLGSIPDLNASVYDLESGYDEITAEDAIGSESCSKFEAKLFLEMRVACRLPESGLRRFEKYFWAANVSDGASKPM